jgi:tRNA(Ile2) C34 agmatinyltransferase TiaS
MKDREILDGITYRYNKETGDIEKIIHIKLEPTTYCPRCGKKADLIHTFTYWFNTGNFDYLCKDCVIYYQDIEKKNHPEMVWYVDQ